MINVIVPIIDKVEEYENFIKINENEKTKFFVGIREDLFEKFNINSKNVVIKKYKNGSKKEEIINALQSCKLRKGKILVARRPLSAEEFVQLEKGKGDITVLQKKRNKFSAALKKFVSNIIKFIFAFSYFDDISAICYNTNMFELLSVCQNLSTASRINRYIGVDIEEVSTNNNSAKREYSKWKAWLKLLAYIVFFSTTIAGVVLLSIYINVPIIAIIFMIFWVFVATVLLGIGLINFTRTISVGDLKFGRAEEII
ncbi:MAG: hypothetical protein E7375_01875 [Clostridiales bacterium]|nr:hypothetical protein [Clostridiales bacterium]